MKRHIVSDEERVTFCQEALGHTFHDTSLLLLALTHSSYTANKLLDNERLEFLGDSILGAVVSQVLFLEFPETLEGHLTERKSLLVRDENLAVAIRALGVTPCFRLGRGVLVASDQIPDSVCANIFEAIVAAIFLDGGFDAATDFIIRSLDFSNIPESDVENFKSALQEYFQRRGGVQPQYVMVDSTGPDHRKRFLVRVMIEGESYGEGKGFSKKQAEQQAAREAMMRIQREGGSGVDAPR